MAALTFQEEGHKYFLDGTELPSVTTLLSDAGYIDKRWFKENDAIKGKRRHKATELMDQGILDWTTVAEADMPYLEAWIKAKEELGIEIEECERFVYHPLLRYAGTIDRLAMVKGRPYVIDLKGGTELRWHQLQLILYGLMVEHDGELPGLMDVYLSAQGSYKHRIHDYSNKPYALAAVRVWVWKNRLK